MPARSVSRSLSVALASTMLLAPGCLTAVTLHGRRHVVDHPPASVESGDRFVHGAKVVGWSVLVPLAFVADVLTFPISLPAFYILMRTIPRS